MSIAVLVEFVEDLLDEGRDVCLCEVADGFGFGLRFVHVRKKYNKLMQKQYKYLESNAVLTGWPKKLALGLFIQILMQIFRVKP